MPQIYFSKLSKSSCSVLILLFFLKRLKYLSAKRFKEYVLNTNDSVEEKNTAHKFIDKRYLIKPADLIDKPSLILTV